MLFYVTLQDGWLGEVIEEEHETVRVLPFDEEVFDAVVDRQETTTFVAA